MMIEKRALGPGAAVYIREQLEQGSLLGKLILDRLDLEAGQSWTYVAPGVEEATLHDFRHGCIAPHLPELIHHRDYGSAVEQVNTPSERIITALIHQHMRQGEHSYFVVWGGYARSTDPWLAELPPNERMFFHDDSVYWYLDHGADSEEEAAEALGSTPFWNRIGALAKVPGRDGFIHPRQNVTDEELRAIADGTEMLVIGAYDGEGYVVWSER